MSEPTPPRPPQKTVEIPPEVVESIADKIDAVLDKFVGPRDWKPYIVAVIGGITALILAWSGYSSVVAELRKNREVVVEKAKDDHVEDINKLLKEGFKSLAEGQGEIAIYLKKLGDKIDATPQPTPVPIPGPNPPPVVQGISLPSTINLGGGHVSIKATSAGPVTWFIPSYDALKIDTFGDVAIVSAKEGANGTYWIGATTVSGGKIAPPVYCAITVNQGPQPPPNPKPDPKPDPTPPVKVDSLSLVIIYESSDTNSKTAKVVADYVFWESLKPLGVKWYKLDKDQIDANGALLVDTHNYRQYMVAKGLPCILYMDKTGMVLKSDPLPDNTAAVRSQITALMGK